MGSAKVEREVTARVPHQLLDVVSLRDPFSAADYYTLASRAMQVRRGGFPIKPGNWLVFFNR